MSLSEEQPPEQSNEGAHAERRRSALPSVWAMFWVTFFGFFLDKLIPVSIEIRFWILLVSFLAGLASATSSWLYLFQPRSRLARHWFRPHRPTVTNARRFVATFGLLLGCALMGLALLPAIRYAAR